MSWRYCRSHCSSHRFRKYDADHGGNLNFDELSAAINDYLLGGSEEIQSDQFKCVMQDNLRKVQTSLRMIQSRLETRSCSSVEGLVSLPHADHELSLQFGRPTLLNSIHKSLIGELWLQVAKAVDSAHQNSGLERYCIWGVPHA